MHRFSHPLGALALAALLVACGGKSAQDYLQSAERHMAQGDRRAAEVELLNAVKAAPSSGAAYRLRGINRLAMRQAPAAEADLQRALQLNEPPAQVLPSLLRALAMQGKSKELLTAAAALPAFDKPATTADVLVLMGDAQLAQRSPDAARQAYQQALAAVPGHALARLGLARLEGANGRADAALAAVEAVLAEQPAEAEAWYLKSVLLRLRGDAAGTRAALERTLAAAPDHLRARLEMATMLIDAKAYDQAAALLKGAAGTAVGDDVRLEFLRALLDARRGDAGSAKQRVDRILAARPDDVMANVLAGELEMRAGHPALAEARLQKALAVDRQHRLARHWLAVVYVQQNAPMKALDTLQPLMTGSTAPDADTVKLAAEARLLAGDLKGAAELYGAVRQAQADDPQVLLRLGQIALAQGDWSSGANALRDAAASPRGLVEADAALVAMHVYRNELPQALQAAEAFKARHPKSALARVLAGQVRLAQGERSGARQEFGAALELDGSALPALVGLAELDQADGKPADGIRRFESRLASRPDESVYLALADFQSRAAERPDDAAQTLRQGIQALPASMALKTALVRQAIGRQNPAEAVALARKLVDEHPSEPALLEVLADAQLAAGQLEDAGRSLDRLATLDHLGARPLQRMAGAQIARRDLAGALATLKRAQLVAPGDTTVLADLARVQIATGALDRAAETARTVSEREPHRAAGRILAGDVHVAARRPQEAERAYRAALQAEPRSSVAALKLCALLEGMQRAAECGALAGRWLEANPGDVPMRLFAANRAAAAGRTDEAARHYELALAREPMNLTALNNAAWLLGTQRNPRALALAQRAARIAPANPDVLNTLGVIELNGGDGTQALEHLGAARRLAPERADLRLHLAKGLIKLQRYDEARTELQALASVNTPFAGQDEVAALLKQLPARP